MENRQRVLIIAPGGLPVPSVNGGAVQNLIEMIIKENENNKLIDLYISTPNHIEAKKYADKNYPNTKFIWIKTPKIALILDEVIYRIVNVFKKNNNVSFRNNFKILFFALANSKLLKKENFDKIIIENNIRNFISLKLYKNYKKYKGKYFFHLHNIPRMSFGCKKIIQNCEKILCVSGFVGNEILKESNPIGPINKDKIVVFKNAIEEKKFIKNDDIVKKYKDKYNIKEDDFVILFAGRLSIEKGVKETIESFKKAKEELGSNLKLLIVGSCFYNTDVKDKYTQDLIEISKGLEKDIIFTGYIDYSEIGNIYHLADVAVLPSIWDEPAGMTMLEAKACGIPIITTNSGGIPEYVSNKGAFILDRDEKLIENIQKCIVELYSNAKLREKFKNNNISESKEFRINNYYKKFLNSIGCDINE